MKSTSLPRLVVVFCAAFASLMLPSRAHNLDTRATSINFAKDFLDLMSQRAGTGQQPVQLGDEFWVILKTVPGPGTDIGVGGYQTFYVPNGVEIVDAAYMQPDAADPRGYRGIPMKGQSPIAIGDGPIGAKAAVGLTGYTYPAPNILGVNEAPVTATGISRGTLAGVYADTGIFFSTDSRTAFNSYGAAPSGGTAPMTNNSGDAVGEWDAVNVLGTDVLGVMTLWDSYQLQAFGRRDVAPIIDPADGRGNAPWGMASAVAGPQSGYAWSFNHAAYTSGGSNAAAIPSAIEVGPWKRIKYPGSLISKDQAGLQSTAFGYAGVDGSSVGYDLNAAGVLPTGTNAVRFAIGQLELGRTEFSAVKVRVNTLPSAQCYSMYADAFGGDAGGADIGKDHIWRYFDPTVVALQACVILQKSVKDQLIEKNGITSFRLIFANLQGTSLPNVVITDPLPSGMAYLGASPTPTTVSGSTLTWNLGTVAAGEVREFTVDVRGTIEGTLFNRAVATSNGYTVAVATDSVDVATRAVISKQKTVSPSAVAPGSLVTYTITVDNTGTGPCVTPVVLKDFLPDGLTYSSLVSSTVNGAAASPTINTTDPANPVMTLSQAINAGQQFVFKFQALVGAEIAPGVYYNETELTYGTTTLSPVPEAPLTVAGGRIGDTVFRDWNGNGVQDAGEEGMSGVTVSLTYYGPNGVPGGGDDVITTKTTDADGHYLFTGLVAGNYQVSVPVAGAGGVPSGYTLTADPDGGAILSTFQIALATDQQFLTADFGYDPGGNGSIGDFVFEDNNNNGLAGPGDVGIPYVMVNLYEDSNNNGIIDAGDVLIATQSTGINGDYLFTGLATGLSYIAKVDQTDPDLVTYFNPNPYQASTSLTKAVSNLSGSVLTADFGFWPLLPSSIGDTVFTDVNGNGVYDPGTDTPLSNITVNLYRDENGNGIADVGELFATQSTDYLGQYSFAGLGPDQYIVIVDCQDANLPGGLTAVVNQIQVNLGVSEDITTADFPFASVLTKAVDRSTAAAGNLLTYTIVPNYPGQNLLTNARVTDSVPAGTLFSSAGQGGTQSGGLVTWNLGTNTAGIPGAGGAAAQSVTLGDDTAETLGDTYIVEDSSDNNFGAATELWVKPDASKVKHALVKWNLSSIPADATITGVSVKFWVRTTKAQTITLHNATQAWDEGAGAAADGADWTKADDNPDIFWTTAGGDFDATSLGTFSAATAGSKTITGTALKNLVQAWVNGSTANQGVFLTTSGAGGDAKLGSSENGTANQRPQLIVSYLAASASPAPFNASADTSFRENSATTNYGGDADLLIRDDTDASADDRTAAVRWDLSTIPSGAVITSASLKFHVNTTRNFTVGVAPLSQSFVESQATWILAQTGTNWTTLGGSAGSQVGTFSTSAAGYQTVSGSNVLSMVQGWVDAPAGNRGVRLKVAASSDNGDAKIDSRENTNPPQLVLTYELASTNTTLTNSAPLVGGSGPQSITVTMNVAANGNTAAKTVTPPTDLTPSGTGVGTIAKFSGPSPATAIIPAGGGSASFTWVYQVTPGSNPGSVKFAGAASATGLNLVSATSPSVLVTPPLTFAVTVDSPITTAFVDNVALLQDDNVIPPTSSPEVITALTASIGDTVFADLDGDGVQDLGEPGLGGIEVCATDGVTTICDTTDGNGYYRIFGLSAGTWTVTLNPATVLAGYLPTLVAAPVTLAASQQYDLADFGLRPPPALASSIGDTLWIDSNEDGVVDAGESLISNVTVRLYNDANNNGVIDAGDLLLLTNTTDSNGFYQFSGLYDGNYLVDVDESDTDFPIGLELVSGGAGVTGLYDVSLGVSQNYTTADFGYNYAGQIGDFVWWDFNRNGVYEPGLGEFPVSAADPGLGVLVFMFKDTNNDGILNAGDLQVGTATVGADGYYLFDNLEAGRYFVEVYDDSIHTFAGDEDDFVSTTGETQTVELAPAESHLDADFGFDLPTTVFGHLYVDVNGNGTQDSGEPNLANVDVLITDSNGVDQTVATDVNGNWVADVPPGSTTANVVESDPDYPAGSSQTEGTDPTVVTAVIGANTSAGNDGYFLPGSLSGTVLSDADNDGDGDVAIEGVLIRLLDSSGAPVLDGFGDPVTDLTDVDGAYSFGSLAPGDYSVVEDQPTGYDSVSDTDGLNDNIIGNFTPIAVTAGDNNGSNDFIEIKLGVISGYVLRDIDNSGSGDEALPGVLLNLRDGSGNPVLDAFGDPIRVASGADGYYSFTLVRAGIYQVFQSQPPGYVSVSDVDGANNNIIGDETPIVMTPGLVVTDRDFVEMAYGYISGNVFADTDFDGNANEDAGIGSVTLRLLDAAGTPVLDTNGAPVTTVTNVWGQYFFDDVVPGDYRIAEDQPVGWASVGDTDGANNNLIGDETPVTVLPATINGGNDFTEIKLGSISGYVRVGADPLASVTLTLLDENGDPVDGDPNSPGIQPLTTVTDGNGYYVFNNVPAGSYQVAQTQPFGYTSFGDADGGDLDIVGDVTPIVILPGQASVENNFIETVDTCPDNWEEWKFQHPGETVDGNPDADAYDNFAEFAFAMPYDSGVGSPWLGDTAWIIRPSTLAPGTLEGVFIRPKGAYLNVTYTLQYAATLGDPIDWDLNNEKTIDLTNASWVDNGDCTETVTIHDLETLTGLTGGTGVVRIKADLDEDPPTGTDYTSYTEVEGWKETGFELCCRTYNNPYLRETTFTGTVDTTGGVVGQTLNFTNSAGTADLGDLLVSGTYYLEVTFGDNEGHRFDIVSASGTTVTLASDSNLQSATAPFNTLLGALPASLAGDRVVIRRHRTLDDLFPPSGFGATNDRTTADQVQVFADGQWIIYWLYDDGVLPARWVKTGDDTYADQGSAVLAPGQGLFFNNRRGPISLLAYGEVRANDFIRPLAKGSSLVGGGYPLDQSATGRAMITGFYGSRDFATADSFFIWKGDEEIGVNGYQTYFLNNNAPRLPSVIKWVKVGDASLLLRDAETLFLGDRSVFIRSKDGLNTYTIPSPWTP